MIVDKRKFLCIMAKNLCNVRGNMARCVYTARRLFNFSYDVSAGLCGLVICSFLSVLHDGITRETHFSLSLIYFVIHKNTNKAQALEGCIVSHDIEAVQRAWSGRRPVVL
jgi:hypothetical protein